ncbi:MAG: phage tail protein [Anaerolineales bacterium]|nr:phage tail protein [Anaerolineales bacterium]
MTLIQTVSGTVSSSSSSLLGQLGSAVGSAISGAATSAAGIGIRAVEEALGIRFDAAPSYLFYVELSGVIVGLFTECSGLEISRKTDTIKEGGVNDYVTTLPGRLEQSEITLKRGLSISRGLWDWFMQGRYEFNVKRINFSIIQGAPGFNLLTMTGIGGWQQAGSGFGKIKHWDVENAFPVKWEIDELNTSKAETVVFETLKIAHHGLSLSYEVGTPMSLAASVIP